MSAASNDLEEKVLNHVLQNVATTGAAYTAPSAVYVSLHTGNPQEDNSGANEIPTSGYNYARESVTFGSVTEVANTVSVSTNATVTFNQASANYPANVTYVGLYDQSTAGNLMFYGALSTEKQVTTGDIFQINSGSLTITLD
jgi:hypothetical protein